MACTCPTVSSCRRSYVLKLIRKSWSIDLYHFRNALYFIPGRNVICWISSRHKPSPSRYSSSTNSRLSLGNYSKTFHALDSHPRFRRVYTITSYFASCNIAHNVAFVKGDSFSSPNTNALRSFLWFRQSVKGKSISSVEWSTETSCLDGKMFERCNFACLELSGLMPVQRKRKEPLNVDQGDRRYLRVFADDDVFNELTEKEMRGHLNAIALPSEEQTRIKADVKNLLDQ